MPELCGLSDKKSKNTELRQVMRSLRGSFIVVGIFSFVANMLMLGPAIYMLQVYDRVLASRNEWTLLMLTILVVGAYVIMAGLEFLRARILIRVGAQMDETLSERVYNSAFRQRLRVMSSDARRYFSDLSTVRQFLTGNGLLIFFDAPWVPVYLIAIALLHPMLGWLGLGAAIILLIMALATEWATRRALSQASEVALKANHQATRNLENAEIIEALGMLSRLRNRWQENQQQQVGLQAVASDRSSVVSSTTKFVRVTVQSLMLGAGAYFVLQNELTPGAMIAGTILLGRALAPVEQVIGNWKNFVGARGAYHRLDQLLEAHPATGDVMELPAPEGRVSIESLVGGSPTSERPILKGVALDIEPGESVGMVGPSASGKSTLARMLMGVWRPMNGVVRLDGANVADWNKEELGPHVGYLPQDIELFDGSVAENIARFGEVVAEKVVEAARLAGVHELILALPNGYDTVIGAEGITLSGGQRQRIALARALYDSPAFVVLDEPNSNLDDVGETALIEALEALKQRGVTMIVITHRTRVLSVVDRLVVLKDGTVQADGPRDDVMAAFAGKAKLAPPQAPGTGTATKVLK